MINIGVQVGTAMD